MLPLLFMEKIKIFLSNSLRSKVKFKNYKNLEDAVKNVFSIIKKKDLLNIRYYLALVQRRLIVLKTSKKEVYILID